MIEFIQAVVILTIIACIVAGVLGYRVDSLNRFKPSVADETVPRWEAHLVTIYDIRRTRPPKRGGAYMCTASLVDTSEHAYTDTIKSYGYTEAEAEKHALYEAKRLARNYMAAKAKPHEVIIPLATL